MKPKPTPLKIAPANVTYTNGKATLAITITNTQLTDWATKKVLQSMLDIKTEPYKHFVAPTEYQVLSSHQMIVMP